MFVYNCGCAEIIANFNYILGSALPYHQLRKQCIVLDYKACVLYLAD